MASSRLTYARPSPTWRGAVRALLLLVAVPLAFGACKKKPSAESDPGNGAGGDDPAASIEVPDAPPLPADAPRLASIAIKTDILDRPDPKGKLLGYFRIGQTIPRSAEPVAGTTKCMPDPKSGIDTPGAWYQVSPKGYVCADNVSATIDLKHPVLKALGHTPPDLSKPMPYIYGFVRRDATLWHFIPHHREMDKFEYAFQGFIKDYNKHKKEWNKQDHADPNDVPLDEFGNAKMLPKDNPPIRPTTDFDHLFPDLDGTGEIPWWLVNTHPGYRDARKRHIPNISSFDAPAATPVRGKISRHAGIAVIGSFRTGKYSDNRKFTVTLDGRLIGEDKVKPHYASPFHGIPIGGQFQFPLAIVRKHDAHYYGATPKDELAKAPFREVIPITGKSVLRGAKYFHETKDGRWLHEDEVAVFDLPKEGPKSFDWKHSKWIDVSITYQSLTMYEGEKPVYATLVSTGADGAGDPKTTKSTIRGEFRIDVKHVTATMDADDPENHFELRDVPWVQYFEAGYALHAAYWHDDFGRMRSHGCVNLSPIDARRLFFWTDPPLPEGWHGVVANGSLGAGTWVRVRL